MSPHTRRVFPGLARKRLALLALPVTFSIARVAFAQPPATVPPYPAAPVSDTPTVAAPARVTASATPPKFSYGITLSTTSESESNSTTVVLAPLVQVAYAPHPAIVFDLAWGLGWAIDGQGLGDSTSRLGNPSVSLSYRANSNRFRLRAGMGITAPLATLPSGWDGRLDAFVFNQTMAMWGMWNQWLWTPDRMAIPASGRASYVFRGGQALTVDAALAPVIGVRGSATGTDLLGQLALEADLPVDEWLVIEPRLQMVVLPGASIDRLQSAAGLRGVVRTGFGRFFAGLLINLDEPLGVFGGLGRWGIHLGKEIDL